MPSASALSRKILQSTGRIVGAKLRTFGEIHHRIKEATTARDFRQVTALHLYLSQLFFDAGCVLQASQEMDKVVERARNLSSDDELWDLIIEAKKLLHSSQSALDEAKERMSGLERTLVEWIQSEPKSKFQLIAHLYGKDADVLIGENRLKNLLHRIRSKFPGLLRYQGGRYSITQANTPKKTQTR